MRIALLVVLAFAGLWFVALRPKPPVDVAPPATPAPKAAPKSADGITSAPEKAERAAARADGSAAAKEAATGSESASGKPAAAKPAAAKPAASAKPATSAKPAPAKAERPGDERPTAVKRVLADLDAKRTTVLLFWDRRVSDDREVRRAVSAVDRHDGKVRVHVVPISKVGDFEPITSGVPVVISPTVLVIGGRDRKARAVQGLTVTRELDELVTKALNAR